MGTVEPVLVGGFFWLGGNTLVVSVWKSVGNGFTGKVELNVWVARGRI